MRKRATYECRDESRHDEGDKALLGGRERNGARVVREVFETLLEDVFTVAARDIDISIPSR